MSDSFDAISCDVQFSSSNGIYVVLDPSSKQSVGKKKNTSNAHGISFQAIRSTIGCSYNRSGLANDGAIACHLALIRYIFVLEIWDRM